MRKDELIPSDDDLQKMFKLAYYLHPERVVALSVTLDACAWIPQVRKLLERRTPSSNPHKQRLPPQTIPRFAVYAASQSWEIDQESDTPRKPARYSPTSEDKLIRYLKLLIWKTMDRPSCYSAVALGHFLYCYQLSDVSALAPDHFDQENIRRIGSYVTDWVINRFESHGIIGNDGRTITRREPTDSERVLVTEALKVLSPTYALSNLSSSSVLETHFGRLDSQSELVRIRAIIDPTFAGFEALVKEYNKSKSKTGTALREPQTMLRVPKFDDRILIFPTKDAGSSETNVRDGEELTPGEITAMKHPLGKMRFS